MEELFSLVEQMTIGQRLLYVLGCLSAAWLLEACIPLVRFRYNKWRHARTNGVFLLLALVVNGFFGAAEVAATSTARTAQFGLFHIVALPFWMQLILTFLALDFVAQYFAHWLLHRVGWLWRFHTVHHTDTEVDATTGTRLHPLDITVREILSLAAMIVMGAPLAFYLFYRLLTILFTFISHANVASPAWLDAYLSLMFVTPNVHKFHHHFERPWTDTNYGGILSIWDRLFGTFVYGDPRRVHYGLDAARPASLARTQAKA